jgi:hypothetical protein
MNEFAPTPSPNSAATQTSPKWRGMSETHAWPNRSIVVASASAPHESVTMPSAFCTGASDENSARRHLTVTRSC